jgi:hypothetical protein
MPVRSVKTQHPSGATGVVMAFDCFVSGCTTEASYGFGGSIRAAMRSGDRQRGGIWACAEHREKAHALYFESYAASETSPAPEEPMLL